jgi:hypothetical protein
VEKERKVVALLGGLLNIHNKLRSPGINKCPNGSKLRRSIRIGTNSRQGRGEVKCA